MPIYYFSWSWYWQEDSRSKMRSQRLRSIRIWYLCQVHSSTSWYQNSTECVRQLWHPWRNWNRSFRSSPQMSRDQDRKRFCCQIHPHFTCNGEGFDSKGDRYHESFASLQTYQSSWCLRGRRWNGSDLWIVSQFDIFAWMIFCLFIHTKVKTNRNINLKNRNIDFSRENKSIVIMF